MDVCLPQRDPRPEARSGELDRQRGIYGYDHDYLPPLAVSDGFPGPERFGALYLAKRFVATRALFANTVTAWLRTTLRRLEVPQDYARLFSTLRAPPATATWRDDGFFARQRLAGPNPMTLRRVEHPDELPFALGPGGVGEGLPGSDRTLEEAVKDGTLYACDYSALDTLGGGSFDGLRRYLPAPRALFHWRSGGGTGDGTGDGPEAAALHPVGIAMRPGAEVLAPGRSRPGAWLAAKLAVQIADANDLEMGRHLARTHLVMEPFAIATPRHLAPNHPLHVLLAPHLRFLIANTRLGRVILMKPGSLSDQLCGGTRPGSLALVKESYAGWSLDGDSLPADLAARHLEDSERLPDFPYRDDGRLLWAAIRQYVGDYLALYYREPGDLLADAELQTWAVELASASGGRVKGMPSRVADAAQLAEVLTTVLFTSGPQHALVNYGQYPFLGFVPNMPLAAYCDVTEAAAFETEADLMRMLPPARWARRQLEAMTGLSAYQYDRFGHYGRRHFQDPAARAVVGRFQARLGEIEETIEERNASRVETYDFLKPSRIPNSISI